MSNKSFCTIVSVDSRTTIRLLLSCNDQFGLPCGSFSIELWSRRLAVVDRCVATTTIAIVQERLNPQNDVSDGVPKRNDHLNRPLAGGGYRPSVVQGNDQLLEMGSSFSLLVAADPSKNLLADILVQNRKERMHRGLRNSRITSNPGRGHRGGRGRNRDPSWKLGVLRTGGRLALHGMRFPIQLELASVSHWHRHR